MGRVYPTARLQKPAEMLDAYRQEMARLDARRADAEDERASGARNALSEMDEDRHRE